MFKFFYFMIVFFVLTVAAEAIAQPMDPAKVSKTQTQPVTSPWVDSKKYCKVNIGVDMPLQAGIEGECHIWNPYYVKAAVGFAPEILMQLQHEFLPSGASQDIDLYRSYMLRMMRDSFVFDGRFGWSAKLLEGPYMEMGWRGMLGGHSIMLKAHELQTLFAYSKLPVHEAKEASSKQVLYPSELMFHHGPIFYVGYSVSLTPLFFFNLEFNVYKPLWSLVSVSHTDEGLPPKKQSSWFHHTIDGIWMISVGVWTGFLF